MAVINSTLSNTLLTGTSGDDYISSSGDFVTLDGGAGNDTLNAGAGNNTLTGGNGLDIFVHNSGGNYVITDYSSEDSISITSGAFNFHTERNDLIFSVDDGVITVKGGAYNITSTFVNAYGYKFVNFIPYKLLIGTSGNDYIYNNSNCNNASLIGDSGDDKLKNRGSNVMISGGSGKDIIYNEGSDVTISGGQGSDTIYNEYGSYGENVLFVYNLGDGNDIIYNFRADSTLSIGGGSYSATTSGDDVIVMVGDEKISLIGAATLSSVNIIDSETAANAWTLNGTTATYGTSSKTLVKVTGVKSLDGISLDGKVVTVAASSLNKKKVSITGSGYTLALADDVSKTTTKKAAWSYKSGTATYKSSYKTAGYSLASNGKSITYTAATTASTLATINGARSKTGLSISGQKITLKNAALKNKVSVSGGYDFNFTSDYKNATITGSTNADTITTNGNNLSVNGGAGDDTLKIFGTGTTVTGGDGADVFIFKAGNNVIADYSEEDLISIAGTAQVTTGGDDVIFSVGTSKLTIAGGADKEISYVDASGKQTYTATSDVSINGKTIVLLEDYMEDSFNITDYGATLQTIDAAAVQLDIEIIGNKLRNSIKGGENNETLIGGKGNDTLTGGEGSDIFLYNSGDGNDLITDYAEDDMIKITKGTIKVAKKNKDVVFTVGSGKITVKGAADKVVTYIDANGKTNYYPAPTKDSVIINGTTVTVLEEYKSETFDVGNVKKGSKVKRIDATQVSHDLEIVGNAKANLILGGAGDDTIYGGKGNDTLQGGEGKNIFVYKSGNDKIVDYGTGDMISLESGAVSNVSIKGSDSVITVGKGKITVVGGADKVITIADKKGNDSLWGTDGADTFLYDGDGNDVIYGFDNTDMLQITGANVTGTANAKGTEVYFKVGSTSKAITLKNFSATSFNVNGTAYRISGTKLIK